MNEAERQPSKILEPHELDPGLMRHACIAAVGYLAGGSIQSKEQMITTLREAVTTPIAGRGAVNSEEHSRLKTLQAIVRDQEVVISDLRAEVARLTAEVERHEKTIKDSLTTIGELGALLDDKCNELAVTTERLAAATEFRFGDVSITKADDDHYYVQRIDDSGVTCLPGRFTYFQSAEDAAIAQGWLPAGEAKGGQ